MKKKINFIHFEATDLIVSSPKIIENWLDFDTIMASLSEILLLISKFWKLLVLN